MSTALLTTVLMVKNLFLFLDNFFYTAKNTTAQGRFISPFAFILLIPILFLFGACTKTKNYPVPATGPEQISINQQMIFHEKVLPQTLQHITEEFSYSCKGCHFQERPPANSAQGTSFIFTKKYLLTSFYSAAHPYENNIIQKLSSPLSHEGGIFCDDLLTPECSALIVGWIALFLDAKSQPLSALPRALQQGETLRFTLPALHSLYVLQDGDFTWRSLQSLFKAKPGVPQQIELQPADLWGLVIVSPTKTVLYRK